jgi:cob(I)alamin adenosyltransferase
MHEDLNTVLETIQSRLIDIGSCLAVIDDEENQEKLQRVSFDCEYSGDLERIIDLLDSELPMLTQFILPSGGESSARAHLARSICRRAERSIIKLKSCHKVSQNVMTFMNRLSDLLFVMARTFARRDGVVEKTYKKAKLPSE